MWLSMDTHWCQFVQFVHCDRCQLIQTDPQTRFRRDHPTRNQNTIAASHLVLMQKKTEAVFIHFMCWWSLYDDQCMEILGRCRDMSGDFCNLLKDQREKEAKAVLRGAGGDLGTVSSCFHFKSSRRIFFWKLNADSNEFLTGGRRESHRSASTFESSE